MGQPIDHELLSRVQAALAALPTREGGIVVVLSTSGVPPALAMLSSGDVLVKNQTVWAVLYAGSSARRRLGGGFSLLVPLSEQAVRVEAVSASARVDGQLCVLRGELHDLRATIEPPWTFEMSFHSTAPGGVDAYLQYWREVREWLNRGTKGEPPHVP